MTSVSGGAPPKGDKRQDRSPEVQALLDEMTHYLVGKQGIIKAPNTSFHSKLAAALST